MNTHPIAAARVVRDLHEFERQLAALLDAAGRLSGSTATARATFGTHPAVGHESLLRLARLSGHLLKANGETARVHQSLQRDAVTLGIPYETTPPSALLSEGKTLAA